MEEMLAVQPVFSSESLDLQVENGDLFRDISIVQQEKVEIDQANRKKYDQIWAQQQNDQKKTPIFHCYNVKYGVYWDVSNITMVIWLSPFVGHGKYGSISSSRSNDFYELFTSACVIVLRRKCQPYKIEIW